jgi:hypothetical protein
MKSPLVFFLYAQACRGAGLTPLQLRSAMTFQGLSLIPQSKCLVISFVDEIGLVFSVSYRPIVGSG